MQTDSLKESKNHRIIAIDGGGILGVIPARWLSETFAGGCVEADLFAGTSTGAIIAAALAARMTTAHIEELYRELGRKVFRDSIKDNIRDLGNLVGAQYDLGNLINALRQTFGTTRLGDLPGKVLIPTFDLDCDGRWRSKVQTNTNPNDPDLQIPVVEAVARSCAAPTYFQSCGRFIDGSVVATNPSLLAIAESVHNRVPLEKIELLSLGTYDSPRSIRGKNLDWGLSQWAKPISRLLLDSGSDVTNFQARQLLGERYTRVSFWGKDKADMDDVEAAFGVLSQVHKTPHIEGRWRDEIRQEFAKAS